MNVLQASDSKIRLFRRLTEALLLISLFQAHLEYLLLGYIGFLMCVTLLNYRIIRTSIKNHKWLFFLLFSFFVLSILFNANRFNSEYFKVMMNGTIWLFLIFYGFSVGSLLKNTPSEFDKLIKFIVFIFLINAITNIIIWYITTGGTIDRYNFVSPITMNVSAGINLSSLGFFLSLENFKKNKIITWLIPILFLVNMFIILTRKEQMLFLLYITVYSIIKMKGNRNYLSKALFIINILLFGIISYAIFQNYFISTYSKYYLNIFSETGNDMLVREYARIEALNQFYTNPIFGIGYGMFSTINSTLTKLGSVHNGAFSILAEWGIAGVVISVFIAIRVILSAIRIFSSKALKQRYSKVIIIFLISSVLTTFISNSVFFPPPNERIYYLYGIIMWIFWGYAKDLSKIR